MLGNWANGLSRSHCGLVALRRLIGWDKRVTTLKNLLALKRSLLKMTIVSRRQFPLRHVHGAATRRHAAPARTARSPAVSRPVRRHRTGVEDAGMPERPSGTAPATPPERHRPPAHEPAVPERPGVRPEGRSRAATAGRDGRAKARRVGATGRGGGAVGGGKATGGRTANGRAADGRAADGRAEGDRGRRRTRPRRGPTWNRKRPR